MPSTDSDSTSAFTIAFGIIIACFIGTTLLFVVEELSHPSDDYVVIDQSEQCYVLNNVNIFYAPYSTKIEWRNPKTNNTIQISNARVVRVRNERFSEAYNTLGGNKNFENCKWFKNNSNN